MNQQTFLDGINVYQPREEAPEFIKGNVVINVDQFIHSLNTHKDDRGQVRLTLKESSPKPDGSTVLYVVLDTWRPQPQGGR